MRAITLQGLIAVYARELLQNTTDTKLFLNSILAKSAHPVSLRVSDFS